MTAHEGLLDDLKNTVSSTIKDFESKGYRLVTDETSKLDENSQLDGLYNVHLEHATEVRPSAAVKVITQTINYISSIDRKVLHDPYRNQIEFRRADTIDLVNKEVINHTWSKESDNFAAVDVPQITGFTRKIDNIPSVSVTPDSQNIVKNVAFTPKMTRMGPQLTPLSLAIMVTTQHPVRPTSLAIMVTTQHPMRLTSLAIMVTTQHPVRLTSLAIMVTTQHPVRPTSLMMIHLRQPNLASFRIPSHHSIQNILISQHTMANQPNQ
ncbi:mucin-binding protein [Lacticaseibacillus saniviri]|uniref:mucin-binding protein n=1 Tax=Lacticaseibacillus saniviri TaxID=931533 RepID=UPI0006D139BF|nr:hypothetical protein [Lacticaseibacillus saniviri]